MRAMVKDEYANHSLQPTVTSAARFARSVAAAELGGVRRLCTFPWVQFRYSCMLGND